MPFLFGRLMSVTQVLLGASILLALGMGPAAAAVAAPPAAAASAVTAGSIVQMVIGLAAVLALVGVAAWLLRRFSGMPGAASGPIRIVGGASVGQRERILLVEVGGTWLLVGVAPGQVRTLHTLAKSESAVAPEAPVPADASFGGWLRRVTERRTHG